MLPHSYQLPAAVFLVLGGALSCFAGYRLFRFVMAIYGFLFGAAFASSMVGATNSTGMIVAGLVGGLVGAVVLVFAYFVGVALLGAGLGALIAHAGWNYVRPGDPPLLALVALAVLGAVAAMVLQRYVIIVSTAFGGAWTVIVGGFTLAGERGLVPKKEAAEVWILYPTSPAPGNRWILVAWIALSLLGTAVQLGITGKKR